MPEEERRELVSRVGKAEVCVEGLTRSVETLKIITVDTNSVVKRIEECLTGDEMDNKDGLIRRVKTLELSVPIKMATLQSHAAQIADAHDKVAALDDKMEKKFDDLHDEPLNVAARKREYWVIGAITFVFNLIVIIISYLATLVQIKH